MTDQTNLRILRLHPDAVPPSRANDGDAGYDLTSVDTVRIPPGARALVRTGWAVAIPPGHVGIIAPRSGLAFKNGIEIMGGVIDSGYRGEVRVILKNSDPNKSFDVCPGVRVAQLVIKAIATPDVLEVSSLDPTERGVGGFGSSGGMAA